MAPPPATCARSSIGKSTVPAKPEVLVRIQSGALHELLGTPSGTEALSSYRSWVQSHRLHSVQRLYTPNRTTLGRSGDGLRSTQRAPEPSDPTPAGATANGIERSWRERVHPPWPLTRRAAGLAAELAARALSLPSARAARVARPLGVAAGRAEAPAGVSRSCRGARRKGCRAGGGLCDRSPTGFVALSCGLRRNGSLAFAALGVLDHPPTTSSSGGQVPGP